MRTVVEEYQIESPIEKVWEALTESSLIEKWGAGPAKMDANEGTKFSLWGGDIHGTNIEMVPYQKIVQEWYSGNWKEPSILTLKLIKNGQNTKVELLHENVPDDEYKDIEEGWKDYYMGPLKEYLESL